MFENQNGHRESRLLLLILILVLILESMHPFDHRVQF